MNQADPPGPINPVVWTDGRFVALRKPAGVPVFPPHAHPEGDCLLRRWLALEPSRTAHPWPDGFGAGIAHRLDTPTSGQVIAAVSPSDLAELRQRFSAGSLRKVYRFVAAGQVPWDAHTVDTPIAHDRRRRSRMVVERGRATPHRGKWYPAHTVFRRVGPVMAGLWCWEAVITSGVMHQIRVHAASVGLALNGDRLYGGGTPSAGAPVPFLLHHLGLSGEGFAPPQLPLPDFWPKTS